MNEYPELFSETLVDGEYVRNDAFLSKISATQRDVFIKKFVTDNSFERSHQVMGRGQLNHVGHILNTANEYAMGKPLSTIFMQYGVGNTLLFKWTMDIFGGVSFQNYYKCYIYYPIYYFAFLIMLYFVFKDALYVFLGFSAVAFMHFFYNYIPLYFAPGLIPTIHFFDVFLILSMFAFFIGRARGCSLLCSLLFVSLGILMNRQFGAMLALAWIVTLAVYAFENRSATKKYLMVILPAALLAPVFLLATKFAGTTSENMLRTYFSGLYSWAPSPVLVMFTIIYFILSYGFLILIRTTRSHLKYLYLLSFVYSQGLFVYFYWAGLVNHFPIVIPYIVFQLILAIKIMENHESPLYLRKIIHNLKPMLLIIALVSVAVAASAFYSSTFGKKTVSRNFVSHRCFEWKFKNARLISTINPAIFNDAAGLINKYADSRGIYIISKFDAILPFVSGRYSMMPHFELNWFVIDDDKCAQVVKKFKEGRPRYIFVDSDMNSLGKDPMAGLDPEGTAIERVSRLGRLNELKKIFHEVSRGYRLVEKGELVSVYEKVI
ncbi:MAG: hypothetical protein NTX59_14170 [Elusimicrobia bacterium]|nr:hypothetical protein [Elusimicrobiota bacterium]